MLSLPERNFVAEALRTETVGGVLLLLAAVAALVWANIPALGDSYETVSHWHFGPESLGLNLSVAHWAADGLLAIFFVAGVELKRELVAGDLRDPKAAALPVIAALCGMIAPALVYTLTSGVGGGSSRAGPCPRPPTSRSRWPCSPSSAPRCPARCAPSCSPSRSWTTCSRS